MSQAHAAKYYEICAKDPALLKSLGDGTKSAEEFLARAVAAAKQQGLEFTAEEARTYMEAQHVEKGSGELSDQQLEAVAGGKGGGGGVGQNMDKCRTTSNYTALGGAMLVGYSWGWNF